jgi:2-phospho-L-lactate guanylyltransferase (CobY/MobA/RfbA family)
VEAQKLAVRCFENDRIALDIDEPKDLQRFLAYAETNPSSQVARKLLAETRPSEPAAR